MESYEQEQVIKQLTRIADAMEAQNKFEREILEANQRHHDESRVANQAYFEWTKQNRAEDIERANAQYAQSFKAAYDLEVERTAALVAAQNHVDVEYK
jgi:hypothetical protein